MANIEHSTLTTTNLHENKGVSTATDNTVATAVTGATVWAKLTASNMTGTGNAFGGQLFHTRDTTGQSFTAGIWNKRQLASVTNEISGASVSSNVLTLPAGTYYVEGFAVLQNTSAGCKHQLRLRNTTDSTTLVVGTSHINSWSGSGITAQMGFTETIHGRFTIAGTKTIELQTWLVAGVSGTSVVDTASGESNVLVDLLIWKVL